MNQSEEKPAHMHADELSSSCADAVALAKRYFLSGIGHWEKGDPEQAQELLSRAWDLDGRNLQYANALAVVWLETGHPGQAERLLKEALQQDGSSIDLLCNLGRALLIQRRFGEASLCLQRALTSHPEHAVSLANMAVVQFGLGRLEEAIGYYRHALAIDPRHPVWWANLGAALTGRARYIQARNCFQQALSLSPENTQASRGLGTVYCAMGRYEEAAHLFERFINANPEDAQANVWLAVIYQHTADWEALKKVLARVAQHTREALQRQEVPAEQPLLNLRRTDDQAVNLAVAQAFSRDIVQRTRRSAQSFSFSARHPGRITIGYLSADFCNHAVAHQTLDMFALHDRARFRVCGFSTGPAEKSDYRERIAATFDCFSDLSKLDSVPAAQAIFDQKVDILVDLTGHTHRNRLDICALRPAPLQVGYLGFLGSSGAPFIDYLVGDPVVTPAEHAPFYSEHLIRMPHCYQVMSRVGPSPAPITRSENDLPEKAFVFCCFNQVYKIDAPLFACWMRILRAVPESILWLFRPNETAVGNLRAAAAQCGVAPTRIVFAPKMALADHLNRLRLADLALDTITYNGGATTANVLAAGVPLVTVLGRHFVSRMSASHLMTLGLSQLVTADLSAYARLAVALATSPSQLDSLRSVLQAGLKATPLMDTAAFVRALERAFNRIWSMHCKGCPPRAVDVDPE
jgi:protein O-GlcNAc transferase